MISQGIDELIEEARHAELQFRWRWRRHGAHLDLRAAAADELFAILGDGRSMMPSEMALVLGEGAAGPPAMPGTHCSEAGPLALDGAADGATL